MQLEPFSFKTEKYDNKILENDYKGLASRYLKTPILAKPSESELANEILREVTVLKPIFAPINVTFHRYNGKVYFFHQDGTYSRLDRNTCQLE